MTRAGFTQEHVVEGTFRPANNGRLMLGLDLPVRPPPAVDSPAARRIWVRLRELQGEYRGAAGVDLRHEIAVAFSKATNELHEAAARGNADPLAELDGLAQIVEENRRARRLYAEKQQRLARQPT